MEPKQTFGKVMVLQNAALKVKKEHIEKLAFIYVRQSTMQGVQKNITGGRRQREDVESLALQLGWPKQNIKIIDEDQARSGSSTQGRYGYLDMLNAISKGCVGAVFSLESTRMARDAADWHFLIKLCHVTGTLVIDPEGVYDASDTNDNTLMKIKALVGEMELHYITERMIGAKLKLAREGTLRIPLPAGFTYSETGSIILTPDPAVQSAVRLAFDLFDKLGSALAVARHFHVNNLKFPCVVRSGPNLGQHDWSELVGNRMARLLQNPFYAGFYVYGRFKTERTAVVLGGVPQIQKYQVPVPREEWQVVIPDAHPAYISWARYLRNNERLSRNGGARRGGAARSGLALLQGMVICGTCGCKMNVQYRSATHFYYKCPGKIALGGKECQVLRGSDVDHHVEKLFLEAIQPIQLEITFASLQRVEEQSLQDDRQLVARLLRAEQLVASLKKRLLSVDYNNKYAFDAVQQELKRREEELLGMQRERADAEQTLPAIMSPAERQSVERLVQDLPLIWAAKTTDTVTKKNLLRCLIEDVTIKKSGHSAQLNIRWKTQASTRLDVELPVLWRTSTEVIDLIERLTPDHTPPEIVAALNEAGVKTCRGRSFTRHHLRSLNYRFSPKVPGAIENGSYSVSALVRLLDIHPITVRRWCGRGQLNAVKDYLGRWRIKLNSDELEKLRQSVSLFKRYAIKRCKITETVD